MPSSVRDLEIRELKPEEYPLLAKVGLFEQTGLPSLEQSKVIVGITSDKQIAAYWIVFDAVHVEPLWIRDDYRKNPGVGRRLWTAVQKVLLECKVKMAFAMIADGDAAINLPQATRLGFQRVPGQLYYIEVKPDEVKALDDAPPEMDPPVVRH